MACDTDRLVTSIYSGYNGNGTLRFFFRKLDNAPFWVMTAMNTSVYHSCQDLVRGIQLTENQRKDEATGHLWSHLPIYFLFRGDELFKTDDEMRQFVTAESYQKANLLFHNDVFIDMLYKKIASCSRIPFLQEWMRSLLRLNGTGSRFLFIQIQESGFSRYVENVPREDKIFTFLTYFNEYALKEVITEAFSQKMISVGNVTAGNVSNVKTLTQYLDQFGDNLVRKAHERFDPLYTPGVSTPTKKALNFFTNSRYFSNLNYFAAQKDVVCSVAKGLARNKRTLIVGECGIGNYIVK